MRGGNRCAVRESTTRHPCFNEAPALRGGNLLFAIDTNPALNASMRPPHCAGEIVAAGSHRTHGDVASMRPPHCAGEIGWSGTGGTGLISCFNEAPALRGGNPATRSTACATRRRFNEAPALRGGNPQGPHRRPARGNASMRPPHCAGEIAAAGLGFCVVSFRFNEAPALRGGNHCG